MFIQNMLPFAFELICWCKTKFLFACRMGVEGVEFNIFFHHAGYMAFTPMVRYVGGEIMVTTEDPDRMSWFELKGILDDLGYKHQRNYGM